MGGQVVDAVKSEALLCCPQDHMQMQDLCPQAPSLGEFIHYHLMPELLDYNGPGPFSGWRS